MMLLPRVCPCGLRVPGSDEVERLAEELLVEREPGGTCDLRWRLALGWPGFPGARLLVLAFQLRGRAPLL